MLEFDASYMRNCIAYKLIDIDFLFLCKNLLKTRLCGWFRRYCSASICGPDRQIKRPYLFCNFYRIFLVKTNQRSED